MFMWKGKRVAMKHIPPVSKSAKEKEPKLILICNRGEFLVQPKETKQNFILVVKEKITPPTEIPEEKRPLLEEFKPPWHHNASIRHDFEDPFLQKENARDESFQFFKIIHLPLARGHDVFHTVCQILSPIALWNIFFIEANQ